MKKIESYLTHVHFITYAAAFPKICSFMCIKSSFQY